MRIAAVGEKQRADATLPRYEKIRSPSVPSRCRQAKLGAIETRDQVESSVCLGALKMPQHAPMGAKCFLLPSAGYEAVMQLLK